MDVDIHYTDDGAFTSVSFLCSRVRFPINFQKQDSLSFSRGLFFFTYLHGNWTYFVDQTRISFDMRCMRKLSNYFLYLKSPSE